MDTAHERDVGGAIVTAIAGALERAKLGKFGFPVTQDVLRDAELGAELTDGPEGVGRLGRGHSRLSWRSGRA